MRRRVEAHQFTWRRTFAAPSPTDDPRGWPWTSAWDIIVAVPHEITTEALVLRRFDTGEADRVVWLLTPGRGRLSAFAAAARKSQRRFAGALEPFTRLSVQLTPPTRGDLWRFVDAQVLDGHASLRDSLEAMACASAASELTAALAVEGDGRHGPRGLYEILLAYLRALVSGPLPNDLYRFVFLALQAAGLRPSFSACVRCGQTAASEGEYFDPAEGGRLCGCCRPRTATAARVSSGLLCALQAFELGTAECPSEGRALLWSYAQHQLGKEVKSLSFLRELGL